MKRLTTQSLPVRFSGLDFTTVSRIDFVFKQYDNPVAPVLVSKSLMNTGGWSNYTVYVPLSETETALFENDKKFYMDTRVVLSNGNVPQTNRVTLFMDGTLFTTASRDQPIATSDTVIKSLLERTATSFVVPYGTTAIKRYALYELDTLESVIIPDSVTSIGVEAFCRSGLTSVTIPDSVTSIGNHAFYECPNLESVIIGNGVTSLDNYTFAYCPELTSVSIGSGITSIGRSLFVACPNLTSITINKPSGTGLELLQPWSATNATVTYVG